MHVKDVHAEGWTRLSTTASFLLAMDTHRPSPAAKIKQLREAKGWTAERLAYEAGVSVKTVSRLENGDVGDPRGDTLRKLALALSIDEADLRPPAAQAQLSQLDRIEAKIDLLVAALGKPPENWLIQVYDEALALANRPRPDAVPRKRRTPPAARAS